MPAADLPDGPIRGPIRASRRALLGGMGTAFGGAVLGACTGGGSPGPRRDTPAVDPDVVVAAEALGLLVAARDVVRATVGRHPALDRPLADLLAAHDAHVATLEDAVPDDATGGTGAAGTAPGSEGPSPGPSAAPGPAPRTRVPREPAPAMGLVVGTERELTTELKRLAFRAESGTFARVLAAVASSAAQYATVLDATVPDATVPDVTGEGGRP